MYIKDTNRRKLGAKTTEGNKDIYIQCINNSILMTSCSPPLAFKGFVRDPLQQTKKAYYFVYWIEILIQFEI